MHQHRLYPAEQIRRKLQVAGFRVTRLSAYGQEILATGHTAFAARKGETGAGKFRLLTTPAQRGRL